VVPCAPPWMPAGARPRPLCPTSCAGPLAAANPFISAAPSVFLPSELASNSPELHRMGPIFPRALSAMDRSADPSTHIPLTIKKPLGRPLTSLIKTVRVDGMQTPSYGGQLRAYFVPRPPDRCPPPRGPFRSSFLGCSNAHRVSRFKNRARPRGEAAFSSARQAWPSGQKRPGKAKILVPGSPTAFPANKPRQKSRSNSRRPGSPRRERILGSCVNDAIRAREEPAYVNRRLLRQKKRTASATWFRRSKNPAATTKSEKLTFTRISRMSPGHGPRSPKSRPSGPVPPTAVVGCTLCSRRPTNSGSQPTFFRPRLATWCRAPGAKRRKYLWNLASSPAGSVRGSPGSTPASFSPPRRNTWAYIAPSTTAVGKALMVLLELPSPKPPVPSRLGNLRHWCWSAGPAKPSGRDEADHGQGSPAVFLRQTRQP